MVLAALDPASRAALRATCRRSNAQAAALDSHLTITSCDQVVALTAPLRRAGAAQGTGPVGTSTSRYRCSDGGEDTCSREQLQHPDPQQSAIGHSRAGWHWQSSDVTSGACVSDVYRASSAAPSRSATASTSASSAASFLLATATSSSAYGSAAISAGGSTCSSAAVSADDTVTGFLTPRAARASTSHFPGGHGGVCSAAVPPVVPATPRLTGTWQTAPAAAGSEKSQLQLSQQQLVMPVMYPSLQRIHVALWDRGERGGGECTEPVAPGGSSPPPSGAVGLRLLIASGALAALPRLTLLDLSGCGSAGGSGGLVLDVAGWECLASGLPASHPLLLRMPLAMMPRCGSGAGPHGAVALPLALSDPASSSTGPGGGAAQPAQQPQAALPAAGALWRQASPPQMVTPRVLYDAGEVAGLLAALAAARPAVAVELLPFTSSACDRAFILAPRPSSAGGRSRLLPLSSAANLRSAPIYITADMYAVEVEAQVEAELADMAGPPAQDHQLQQQQQQQQQHGAAAAAAVGPVMQAAVLRSLPPGLTSLSVSGFVPDDTGLLDTLAGLHQLRRLYLVGMVLGGRGVAQLARLPHLEHISVDVLTLAKINGNGNDGSGSDLPQPVLPQLRSLTVHDLIVSRTPLTATCPALERLALGDSAAGVESGDPVRRARSREANARMRRSFLAGGGLCGLRRLARLELWDRLYPARELVGSGEALGELVIHDQSGGRWSAELALWAGSSAAPRLRHLHLAGCSGRAGRCTRGAAASSAVSPASSGTAAAGSSEINCNSGLSGTSCSVSGGGCAGTNIALQGGAGADGGCCQLTLSGRGTDGAMLQQLLLASLRRPGGAGALTCLVLEDLARGVASEELVQRLVRCLPGLKQLRLRRCADLGESWAQRLSTTLRRSRLQVEFVPAPASAAVGVP
eukprot:XP_001694291.1 predicted protein [Chlamydomonas reinhardtii]